MGEMQRFRLVVELVVEVTDEVAGAAFVLAPGVVVGAAAGLG